MSVQPVDMTVAPYSLSLQSYQFNSTRDYVQKFGFNALGQVATEPEVYLGFENDFEDTPGDHKTEGYWQVQQTASSTGYRPFGFAMSLGSGAVNPTVQYAGGAFTVLGGPVGGPPTEQWYVADNWFQLIPDPYAIFGTGTLTISTGSSKQLALESGGQLNLIAQGGVEFLGADTIEIGQSSTVQHATMDNNISGTRFYPTTDNTGSLGLPDNRWGLIRGTTITSGDLHLEDKKRGAKWMLREEPTFILAVNERTGERRKVPTVPLTEDDEQELRKNDPGFAK